MLTTHTENSEIKISAGEGAFLSLNTISVIYGDDINFKMHGSLDIDASCYIVLSPNRIEASVSGELILEAGFAFEINNILILETSGTFTINPGGTFTIIWEADKLLSFEFDGGLTLMISDFLFKNENLIVGMKSAQIGTNGDITVDTKVGEGTNFVFRLPLTLATIQSLLVSSGGTIYAIPLVSTSETLRLKVEDVQTLNQREVIRFRDSIVPLLRLNELLDTRTDNKVHAEMIHIVVVNIGERMVGLVVDSLMKPQEVVVKSMGSFAGNIPGIVGASILGSGEVVLILDAPTLIKSATVGECSLTL